MVEPTADDLRGRPMAPESVRGRYGCVSDRRLREVRGGAATATTTTTSVKSMWEVEPGTLRYILIQFYDLSASSHTIRWEPTEKYTPHIVNLEVLKIRRNNVTELLRKYCLNIGLIRDEVYEINRTCCLRPRWRGVWRLITRWFTFIDLWLDPSGYAHTPGHRHGDFQVTKIDIFACTSRNVVICIQSREKVSQSHPEAATQKRWLH